MSDKHVKSQVKVTDEDGLLSRSMMIKANNTIMKERIWINRVASKVVFQPGIQTMALRHTVSVCVITVREKPELHLQPCQRDVTDMNRSGEWLNVEPRNLVFDSRCVILFQGVQDCTSECPRTERCSARYITVGLSPTMCGVAWSIWELMSTAIVATSGPNYLMMWF